MCDSTADVVTNILSAVDTFLTKNGCPFTPEQRAAIDDVRGVL